LTPLQEQVFKALQEMSFGISPREIYYTSPITPILVSPKIKTSQQWEKHSKKDRTMQAHRIYLVKWRIYNGLNITLFLIALKRKIWTLKVTLSISLLYLFLLVCTRVLLFIFKVYSLRSDNCWKCIHLMRGMESSIWIFVSSMCILNH